MRKQVSYEINDPPAQAGMISFKEKLLHFAKHFSHCCVLHSNEWENSNNEMIVAMGAMEEIIPCKNSFDALKKFYAAKNDWLFGFLTYDLKNEIENLPSENLDGIGFPPLHFFQPKFIFVVRGNKVEISFLPEVSSEKEVENLFYEISNIQYPISNIQYPIELENRISREEYLQTIYKIKKHIHRGDIYEMNYCMEFFSEDAEINPAEVFLKLNETSQSPFSAFYRMNNKYLLCASPERFLKKEGRKIISQPIKGTARRGKNSTEDIELKELLSQNEKEKSENVMIVDLVRNDLSRTCENVNVDELFGVYTFKQWHQMISTVCGEMKDKIHFTEVIKNSFPMGSMTGAPKVRAMELIEQYEKTKRGLYSGAVGYITPPTPLSLERGVGGEADFDFNVVIRSILYNASSKYLSFQAGSAITANSIPENEYEECLLKAKGMFSALGAENPKS